MRSRIERLSAAGAWLLLAVCVLAAAAGPAGAWSWGKRGVKGSGKLETRELDLDRFTAIELGGAFDVEITFGKRQRVAVTIDDNLWDVLHAEVSGRTLELGWDESCRPDDDCRVEIVMTELERMDVSGAGEVRVRDYHGDRFHFGVSGAAELQIDGEVDRLEVSVSGAAEVDARELHARHAEVVISGAGQADVYASESFDGTVSGVGSIEYWGEPATERSRTSGVGSIKRR